MHARGRQALHRLRCAMAVLVILGLLPVPRAAAALTNGANAIDLFGQYADSDALTPVYTTQTANYTPNDMGLDTPPDIVLDEVHHRLFVSDTNNHRILGFDLDAGNTLQDKYADYVLGQANFYSNGAAVTQAGMQNPYGLAYDSTGDRLFVANSNRVTVYDTASITNGENATGVLGQSTFTASTAANTQAGLNSPWSLAYDAAGNRLFVSAIGNHRVTVYDVATVTNGENATGVLGQSNFTSFAMANSQAGMAAPYGIAYDPTGNRLFATGNNRVTVYDVATVTNGENATHVLGQSTFTGFAAANTQAGMFGTTDLVFDDTNDRLFVSQSSDRVTVYDVATVTNGENATAVLGHANFTSFGGALTQAGLGTPYGMAYDEGNSRLYVVNRSYDRVTVYDVASITNGENAIDLLGQYDDLSTPDPVYTQSIADHSPNELGLNTPRFLALDSVRHRLFLSDGLNNRVLVYNMNSDHSLPDKYPDAVLGQPNFSTITGANTQAGLAMPSGLAYDPTGDRLFVAGYSNNRVTVYDTASISNGENAVAVLGQSTFTGFAAANTQAGLKNPYGLAFDAGNNRLFVSGYGNNRVTVYDVATVTDGENATGVLGQSSFTAITAATSQAGMSAPTGLAFDAGNNRLFVSGYGNNRVTVYDVATVTDGENATGVLGQSSFTALNAANTQAGMNGPDGLAYDAASQRLFVAAFTNNRVTVYDVATVTNGENATGVLGQSSFTGFSQSVTQSGLRNPEGVLYDPLRERLYVVNYNANRVTVYDAAAKRRNHWFQFMGF